MMAVSLIDCPRDVFRDFCALVAPKVGAKRVNSPRVQLSGPVTDTAEQPAKILEYAIDGTVVARLVDACGLVHCWLRPDLATEVLVVRADQEAERERVIREVKAYAEKTRKAKGEDTYVCSSAMLHAAARHQSRIGRLHDHNSRGDRTRANLAGALERASKAGV